MLKFRADTPESRRQLAARREEKSLEKSVSVDDRSATSSPDNKTDKTETSDKAEKCVTEHTQDIIPQSLPSTLPTLPTLPATPTRVEANIYEEVTLGDKPTTTVTEKDISTDKTVNNSGHDTQESRQLTTSQTAQDQPQTDSQRNGLKPTTVSQSEQQTSQTNTDIQIKPPVEVTVRSRLKSSHSANADARSWSVSSGEFELLQAIQAKGTRRDNNNTIVQRKWSIPDTDSDDDFAKRQEIWAANSSGDQQNIMSGRSAVKRFNLPSDSEEEDPYATAKSPSMSIKSAEPPLPPPVSTIPKSYNPLPIPPDDLNAPSHSHVTKRVSAQVDLRKKSITSASDTDPYDEIDYDKDKPKRTLKAPSIKPVKENAGQSEPRYKFTLTKSKGRLNPPEPQEETYAQIPRKAQWNFPSSSDDDEDNNESNVKGRSKRQSAKPKSRSGLSRQESTTSEEGERPVIPPKLWETQGVDYTEGGADSNDESEEAELRRSSDDSGIREKSPVEHEHRDDDITIEYSALQRSDSGRTGSLLGPDELEDHETEGSPLSAHSSGFGENNDMIDASSVLSENSSKAITDYEQSSTCVDMDQLSLDSSGKRPKRIVETHETHEIVPADNNEDDIVERIIETQTITEKLDDNSHMFSDYQGEDLSKYLDDDDEFVSHIFTMGRTMEKGAGRKKDRKSRDFAFVQNPFSAPEPQIETMPLEKKTVKQKITTLVKKKKAGEESVYAEVEYAEVQPISYSYTGGSGGDSDRSGWDDNPAGESKPPGSPQVLEDGTAVFQHEHIDEINDNNFIKVTTTERRKEPKTEKKSLFKGIRKLLKKKDKTHDGERGNQLVLEDDYQEYVP